MGLENSSAASLNLRSISASNSCREAREIGGARSCAMGRAREAMQCERAQQQVQPNHQIVRIGGTGG